MVERERAVEDKERAVARKDRDADAARRDNDKRAQVRVWYFGGLGLGAGLRFGAWVESEVWGTGLGAWGLGRECRVARRPRVRGGPRLSVWGDLRFGC